MTAPNLSHRTTTNDMPLVFVIGGLAVVVVLVAAFVLSQNTSDSGDEGAEVPYIPIDGAVEDVEAPVESTKTEPATEQAMDDSVEASEPLLADEEDEKKKKDTSIIGQVKRSRSVKKLGKAVNSMLKQ